MHGYLSSTPEERTQRNWQDFWFLVLIISFLATVIALIIGLWMHAGLVAIIAVAVGIPVMACSLINVLGHPRPNLVAGVTAFIVLAIGSGIYLWQHAGVLH